MELEEVALFIIKIFIDQIGIKESSILVFLLLEDKKYGMGYINFKQEKNYKQKLRKS